MFRLNATLVGGSGCEPAFSNLQEDGVILDAFRRNTAERVYRIEAAHNPEVAGSNPAPATAKGAGNNRGRGRRPRPRGAGTTRPGLFPPKRRIVLSSGRSRSTRTAAQANRSQESGPT